MNEAHTLAHSKRFGWEFVPPIAAVVLLAILSLVNLVHVRDSERESASIDQSLSLLNELLRDLLNAETGQRGFLLTGDHFYLEPYYAARAMYGVHFEEADKLISDKEAREALGKIAGAARQRFDELANMIELQTAGDTVTVTAMVNSGIGKATMDELRTHVTHAEATLLAKKEESDRQSATAFTNSVVTFATALLFTLAASVWSFLRVDRELHRRRMSEWTVLQRSAQLQSFADVVARVFSARDVDSIIGIALHEFRQLIGAREALLQINDQGRWRVERGIVATGIQQPSEEYLRCVFEIVRRLPKNESTYFRLRQDLLNDLALTQSEEWQVCSDAMDGVLSAPLRDSSGQEIGRIVLMGKFGEDFNNNDCLLVSQLAYSVSVALNNANLTQQMASEAAKKDEFLAMLGHELRNPLAGVVTGSEALLRIGDHTDEAMRLKQSILRQATMISRIVDDLLDVSRIGQGKINLALTEIDIRTLVNETIQDYHRLYEGRRFHIDDQTGSVHPCMVYGDRARITQSLANLIHNACKFSPEDSKITVRLHRNGYENPTLRIEVIDQGIGLTPAEQSVVCELFHQVHTTIERAMGGLGIGLTLAKGLIEMHGGELLVASDGPGQGSTFTIRLPIHQPSDTLNQAQPGPLHPPSTQSPSHALNTRNAQNALHPPLQSTNFEAPSASGFPDDGKLEGEWPQMKEPKRVLVIDDRPDAILPIRVLLGQDGHEVFEAHDGSTGVTRAVELAAEVVFCDIGLPGELSGYDVVRELRQQPTTRDAFIVALSGYSQPSDRQRSRDAGFDLHLAKPVDAARLRDVMRRNSTFGRLESECSIASESARDQANDEQNDKDDEQNLRDSGGAGGNPTETENPCDQCQDEKG